LTNDDFHIIASVEAMNIRILKHLIRTIKYSRYIIPVIMALAVFLGGGTHGGDPIDNDPVV